MLKATSYKDSQGRWWQVMLPEEAPDTDAPMGIPVGPPSLASLELPLEVEVRLHNELFHRRLFTVNDATARRMDIVGAIMAAFKVDAGRIVDLYEEARPRLEAEKAAPKGKRQARR